MAIIFSIALAGFTAMVSQVVFIRELLVVFYGNELSAGFIFASWLICGALGSAVFGRSADRIGDKSRALALCQLSLGISVPLSVIAIRSIRWALGINPGEVIPVFIMISSSLIVLAPVSAILGCVFSVASAMRSIDKTRGAATGIGQVYMIESAGAMAGGLTAGIVLIRVLSSLQITAILNILNISAAVLLLWHARKGLFNAAMLVIASVLLAFSLYMWPSGLWRMVDTESVKRQWRGHELLASKNSIFGNVAVTRDARETSFFDNGLYLYTVPDRMSAEETAHFALLEHPKPEAVLLVGGGSGGVIGEMLKHPIRGIDYVELDPLIVEMAKDYLPDEYYAPLRDKRVSIKNDDGRHFIKNTGGRYDCVIIGLGDPCTAQLNRYYSLEFFKETRRILKDGGIVILSVTGSENYINKESAVFLRSIYYTLKGAFEEVGVIPGDKIYFIGSDSKTHLTYDHKVLMNRANKRGLDLKYVREYYLSSRLSRQKIRYLESVLKNHGRSEVNTDLKPLSYYYWTVFWAAQFKDSFMAAILGAITGARIWICIYFIIAAAVLHGIYCAIRRKPFYNQSVLSGVAVMGFSAMALQIVILFSFQVIYGYLYYKIAMILAFFMAGLVIGASIATALLNRINNRVVPFIFTQAAASGYALTLPLIFSFLPGPEGAAASWVGPNLVFALLPSIAGMIAGAQFPLAVKMAGSGTGTAGRMAGIVYGADLLGSSLGAVLTAAFLLPVIGVAKTCQAVAILNLASLLLVTISSRLLKK